MDKSFFIGNRRRFAASMKPGSIAVLFAGREIRKTNDEYYPFFAQRNFVYLTGIGQKNSVLVICKEDGETFSERLYLLPGDAMAERWTGRRLTAEQAAELSGVTDIRPEGRLLPDLQAMAICGRYENIYLDLFRYSADDIETAAHGMADVVRKDYPFLNICNANAIIRSLRTLKQPCEIDALRQAEKITGAGILAMMRASRPGMYEYQYKAEFDRAIGQFGPDGPGFPSIISAGSNNFCIHYYSYTGQAQDGDMVLFDLGAEWGYYASDVSRTFPVNGKFTQQQKDLYNVVLKGLNAALDATKPGQKKSELQEISKNVMAEELIKLGMIEKPEEISKYYFHGSGHYIGLYTHDVGNDNELLEEDMVFTLEPGLYFDDLNLGIRIEDTIVVTKDGCEVMSDGIPKTVEEIEAFMAR